MRSATNADVARGHDVTIVVALRLAAAGNPVAEATRAQLDDEMAILREDGRRAELVLPDDASVEAFGPNLMDGSHRRRGRAGRPGPGGDDGGAVRSGGLELIAAGPPASRRSLAAEDQKTSGRDVRRTASDRPDSVLAIVHVVPGQFGEFLPARAEVAEQEGRHLAHLDLLASPR